MDWRVKGIIQKVLGALPGGHALHFHLQRRFGGLRDFDGELASKVDDWEIMVGHLRDAGIARRAVELGAQRRRRNRPAERMFAAAAAHHEDSHGEALTTVCAVGTSG